MKRITLIVLCTLFVMLVGCTNRSDNPDVHNQSMAMQAELQHETFTEKADSVDTNVTQEFEIAENLTEDDNEDQASMDGQQNLSEHDAASCEESSTPVQGEEISSEDFDVVAEDEPALPDDVSAEVPQPQPEETLDNPQAEVPVQQPEPQEPVADEEITIKDEALVPIDPNNPVPEEDDYSNADSQALAALLQSLSYVHPTCDGLYDYSVAMNGVTYHISIWCKCVSIGDYEAHLTDSQVAQIIEYINP